MRNFRLSRMYDFDATPKWTFESDLHLCSSKIALSTKLVCLCYQERMEIKKRRKKNEIRSDWEINISNSNASLKLNRSTLEATNKQQKTRRRRKKPSIIMCFDLLLAHPLNISFCLSFLITFHFLYDEADIINREYAFYIHHFDIIYVSTSFLISHNAQDGLKVGWLIYLCCWRFFFFMIPKLLRTKEKV